MIELVLDSAAVVVPKAKGEGGPIETADKQQMFSCRLPMRQESRLTEQVLLVLHLFVSELVTGA
jgi:hypothetical protein